MYDTILGYKFIPSLSKAKSIKVVGSDTILNILYSSDALSRRISDKGGNHPIENRSLHALFLGCSFTFGEGLKYESTFPYIFEKLDTNYKAYNYGFRGYGPHQMALLFDEGVNKINHKAVQQNNGFALYTYINDHQNRVYGGSNYLTYGEGTPDIYVKDSKLIISKRSKLHLFFAKLIRSSNTLKYFNISLNYPHSEDHYKRFADIINYIAKKYLKLYPGNHFFLGIYPETNLDTSWVKYLNANIKIILVPLPKDYLNHKSKYLIDSLYDLHPNLNFNKYYIGHVYKAISKIH